MGKLDPNKIRVAVSMQRTTVAEFRALSKELGFDKSFVSEVCEDAVLKTIKLFKVAKAKGKFSVVDLFQMIGEEMEAIENEKPAQKTTRVEKKPRR